MHQRLVKARRMIRRRIREGQPFMFLDEGLAAAGPVPSTNNLVESWNARLRDMPRRHRGLRLVRRLKAICWWCHQHTERPESDAWLAANAMTRAPLPAGMGEKPAEHARDVRHSHETRHRHRLERVPHQGRMAVERLDRRTYILAYNPEYGRSHQKQKGFRDKPRNPKGG